MQNMRRTPGYSQYIVCSYSNVGKHSSWLICSAYRESITHTNFKETVIANAPLHFCSISFFGAMWIHFTTSPFCVGFPANLQQTLNLPFQENKNLHCCFIADSNDIELQDSDLRLVENLT